MGIEPTALAWEARVLPLYDARSDGKDAILSLDRVLFNGSIVFSYRQVCGIARRGTAKVPMQAIP